MTKKTEDLSTNRSGFFGNPAGANTHQVKNSF